MISIMNLKSRSQRSWEEKSVCQKLGIVAGMGMERDGSIGTVLELDRRNKF
jgi:hypothetical protein